MTTYLAATFPAYTARLREFIHHHATSVASGAAQSSGYDLLSLALFALQFEHNAPYRQFCQSRKVTPQDVGHWSQIPAMPASGFKELELTSLPATQRTRVFHSSGTTEQRPSRHFHNVDSLAIYEASLKPWFEAHLLPESEAHPQHFVLLTPPPEQAPHSSLVYMLGTLRREFAAPESIFTGEIGSDGTWALDLKRTLATLREAIACNCQVVLLGTAFSFVHLLDGLCDGGARLQLPPGSRVMETGGYKGRSRTMPRPELHELITDALGIPSENIVCEYGMSELSSQAYDGVAGTKVSDRVFNFPPWARVQIISPETGREVAEGETGLIRIFDLANVQSVMAIQTEDLSVRRGSGFELLGRAQLSEPRGCSLQSA